MILTPAWRQRLSISNSRNSDCLPKTCNALKTVRNSLFNLAGFAVSAAVGLFYTPYLVRHLGIESYGVVPLVMSLFIFANWISLAVNWSVGRYLTIAYARGEHQDAAKIFNTSLFASFGVFLLLVVIAAFCAPFVGRLLRLPPGTEQAAKVLLFCGAFSTGFGIISGVTEVGFFCLNRFDFRAIMQVFRGLGTVLIVLLLFRMKGPRLELIGVGSCFVAGVAAIVSYFWNLRLIPSLVINVKDFSLEWLQKMFATNLWIVVDQFGTILMLNMNLLLANRFFGPSLSAEFALASQWETLLKSVMTALTVFTPTYMVLVAKNDLEGLRATCRQASRFVSILIAIVGGMLIGFSGPIVRIWLHREAPKISLFIIGLAIPVILNAASNPLSGVWHAFNKVKTPSFATIIAGGLSILVSMLLTRYTHLGPWAIIIGSGCAYTARNMFFAVHYAGKLVSLPGAGFLGIMARSSLGAAVLALTGLCISVEFTPGSWIFLGACSALAMLASFPFFWFFVLIPNDRWIAMKWMQQIYPLLLPRAK